MARASKSAHRAGVPERSDAKLPGFVEPCLATLVDKVPTGERWLHEIKWDGYRLIARVENGRAKILTRRGHDWTARFPTIAKAIAALPVTSVMLDGEAVVEDERGIPSFSALQAALGAREGPGHKAAHEAVFYAFDILFLDGHDLRERPLETRRRALIELLGKAGAGGHVRLSEHQEDNGEAMLRHACGMGLEGIISKRRDGPYRSGRQRDWLKIKCTERQEFVVVGYVTSSANSRAIGAVVLGYYDDGALVHAGRVGTGFTATTARDLWARLQPLRGDTPSLAENLPSLHRKGVIWVRPDLVAKVELRGWTSDGLVRHASFKGLREDKDPREVVRERT
jgi:bifunctional non-homologous end joining protein LigD